MNYEELENVINKLKSELDETTVALISDDLLNIMSNYKNIIDERDSKDEEIEKLKSDKEELLKVNGKLFQKIGFENEEKDEETKEREDEEDKVEIEDIIDEKGDMI